VVVGVHLERTPELVVALLGVLKAGGAFLPLDTAYPPARLELMLREARVPVLVTREALADSLPSHGEMLVLVDVDRAVLAGQPTTNPAPLVTPAHLAYVIFTSGSTGTPKGSLLPHRGLSNTACALRDALGLGQGQRLSQLASIGFDASVAEVFSTLLSGAQLCLAEPESLLPGPPLQQWLAREGITALMATPTALAMLEPGALPSLAVVASVGEACTPALAARWKPGRRFLDAYGPTEVSICATVDPDVDPVRPSIGRAIAGARVYVLDGNMEPVPPGVPGELYVGGPGLARGYLHRPSLSAECFVPDPFATTPGERLYRTGDRVRPLPDGRLEFLGRRDAQVKVRGVRVEPGEVEAVLAQCPGVRQAVVVPREDGGEARLVAYVVTSEALEPAAPRRFLKERLPEALVPSDFVTLAALPLTSSGKVDRRALPPPGSARAARADSFTEPRSELERRIAEAWAQVLGVPQVGLYDHFFDDLGGSSLRVVKASTRLREALGREVPVTYFFEHPTVHALAARLEREQRPGQAPPSARMPERRDTEVPGDIAIIGMAGRFPGARDIHAFWENLRQGVESISRFTPEELEPSPLLSDSLRDHPDFVPAAGVLEGAEGFDAGFFEVSPREAQWMDPQQRLFLQCAWNALEDAGYDPERFRGLIALYVGAGSSEGHVLSLLGQTRRDPASLFEALGTTKGENAATKAAFKLKLAGESLNVSTACSTGLVAVHLACRSLRAGESDLALAGAVKVSLPQRTGYLFQEGMILSPDGHCRAFDARARGTVPGSGLGVVVLKRLSEALRDGDRVYAVIKGSALNNDADAKVSYTAPSVQGQREVIARALASAGVDASSIGYVEAHGTGTPLGDPIEIAALTRAYRTHTDRTGYCAIGSVKTNIGHLDTAAGIAGLIKTALALHHGELPPSLHFERPNPEIDFEKSPFFVNTALRPWERGEGPRRAGVSSFGIGGTNAHVVLEEAPPQARGQGRRRGRQLVTLSARTASALEAMSRELADHVEAHPEVDLADVAFTRAVGRKAFEFRRTVVAGDTATLVRELRKPGTASEVRELEAARSTRVAFLFPGQGAQSVRMAQGLYESEPLFQHELDVCLSLLPGAGLAEDLHALLFPEQGLEAQAEAKLAEPRFALPALLAVEYALARLWMGFGFEPSALLGHSFGEYTAACLSGVLSLEDALRLAVVRGELMSRLPPGGMLMVGLSPEELRPQLPGELELAAFNGPFRCVVSGPLEPLASLERSLGGRGVGVMRLAAAHAFHSRAVEPLMPELERAVAGLTLNAPGIPYVSSLTGTWIRPEEATSPRYWARQMREPVRFTAGLDALVEWGCGWFIEVGPDQGLTALARLRLRTGRDARVVPSLPRSGTATPEEQVLLESVGALWRAGAAVDWEGFHARESRRRVSLPGYPFEEQRFTLEVRPAPEPEATAARAVVPAAPAREASVSAPEPRAPQGDIEQRLVELWRERLGVTEIGPDDNFLELGGNSLMAAQLLTRLRDTFQVQLPLSDLFEAPTVASLAERIELRLQAERPGGGAHGAEMQPIPRTGELPLSYVQERVWELELQEPGSSLFNEPLAVRISGALQVAALERGFNEVIRRHESLRTVFHQVEGRAVPRILPEVRIPLPVVDLRDFAGDREAEAMRLARLEPTEPFSLERGPLVRVRLLRLAETEHVLLVTIHHIVADTLSLVNFIREAVALYTGLTRGVAVPLPELPIQYIDFAAWQRQALADGTLAAQQAYWRQRLARRPGPLPLPLDRPRVEGARRRGARHAFRFSRRLGAALRDFSQREGLTPYMTLLACFKVLLARCSGQEDIVVGTSIGNRTRPELEPQIGYVAHALALRTRLDGDPDFRELALRVRDTTLSAFAHPDVPYEQLLGELEPGEEARLSRLFDAIFLLHTQDVSAPIVEFPGLRLGYFDVTELPAQYGTSLADLTLLMREDEHGFSGTLEYAVDLFDASTISRWVSRLESLLADAVASPDTPLSRLSLDGAPVAGRSGPVAVSGKASVPEPRPRAKDSRRPLDFSLFYFANDAEASGRGKYQLLIDGAKFADTHGFSAVWTPERHFHAFGGPYPSPTATSAALAMVTERVAIRAGSVVLPLHDPVRVAEEWSVVDNLSNGRAGVSFATGWNANDFIFAPENFHQRPEAVRRGVEEIRALWRGGTVRRTNGQGAEVEVSIRPTPVQAELPLWLTAAFNPDTFRLAGELGTGLLTNVLGLGQDFEELTRKIALYREARREAGYDRGHVVLMLHTFVAGSLEEVRRRAREPLIRYFRSSVELFQGLVASQGLGFDVRGLTPRDMDVLLEQGVSRYLEAGGLFGTPETLAARVEQLRQADVDEVACLIDFGLEHAVAMEGLRHLDVLRRSSAGGGGELLTPTARRGPAPSTPAPAPMRSPPSRAEALIPRVPRTGELPLSFAQQRLWFLDQYQPGTALYNIPSAMRLEGRLDTVALGRAFAELMRRHEALHTTFQAREGHPVQVLAPESVSASLEVEDLEPLPPEQREAEALRLAREEASRPFDLSRGPLLRTRLLRLSEAEHLLLVTMHHIVSDGWSIGVLIREVVALYEAFVAGRPSSLPELPIQYADYAVWQREWLKGPVLEEQLAWWKERLAGAPPALELLTDRPRTPDTRSPGASLRGQLPLELMQGLRALCRREKGTLFMGLLAGLQALLSRYTGQEDLCVGAPIAGRTQPQTEGLIGFFVNTLALRTRLDGDPSFQELLRRVRDVTLGAYAHADVPFEKLVEVLQPPRQAGHTPFFQVTLVLLNTPSAELVAPGLTFRPVDVDSGTSKFDLTLVCTETPRGLSTVLEYRSDLFEPTTAARLMEHLRTLLEDAVAHPGRRLSELSLMSEAERRQVLVEWNAGAADATAEPCVHELFEAQAARTPDAVAVVFDGGQLTYAELERRANQLAWHLRALGVETGDRVALCLERSPEMVVSVLAVLKMGAAFVPVDPQYPAERLAFMLEDSGASRVLTQSHLLEALPRYSRARAVCVDAEAEAEALSRQSDDIPEWPRSPDALCYIIYTSGSTGRPKGIAVPHRTLSNVVAWQRRQSVRAESTTLQFASLNFDVSYQEMFATWAVGGTLAVPSARVRQDMPALLDFIVRHEVERLFLPFIALRALVEAVAHAARVPERLREVVTAGEQLQVTPALVSFFERLPGCVLENQYGPSEAHVVSAYRLRGAPSTWPLLPSVGSAVPGTRLYVLDAHGRPCAIGVPGEVFVGGVQVALGYHDRPELTAERFLPDALSGVPGARLYRTGDRARWKAEGVLEYLGRLDGQVKVRGFRIELGEVEAALRDAPGVREAAAMVREDTPGDKRLVAYVVLQPDTAWDPEALRQTLARRMPEYMLPSALVRLDALPLMPTGKLVRSLLPAPDVESLRGAAPLVEPRNPLEQALAEAFARVLNLSHVGVTDNFFSLGGHSLLATQVVARVRAALGVEVALREMFEAPTVESLARRLEGRVPTGTRRASLPVIVPRKDAGDAELSYAQQRLWFLDQFQPDSPLYNMPAALRLEGALDVAALERAFTELVRRHAVLRTSFEVREGRPVQVVAPAEAWTLEVEDLSYLPASEREEEALRLAREEARRPFDLTRAPLLRTRLLRLSEQHHLLVVTMHHIISDGWSIGVLTHEMVALYEAAVAGRPSALPPLPIQYTDYSAWQREWLQGEVLERQLDYWRTQLDGAPPALELTTDWPRTADTGNPGTWLRVELPRALTQALTALCKREGATLFMGLLAGLQALLSRYSGQDDVCVGAPIAGRTQAETEGLIGFFVNTLVMRTRLDGDPTFRELLGRVKDVTLEAYAHQDVPFERLVEVLQPPRQPERTPFFQVALVMLNTPSTELSVPGLSLNLMELDSGTAKFDFTLTLSETPQGLRGALEYRTDLYEDTTAARLVEHLRALLEDAVVHPERRLSELSLLAEEERRRVLVEWNETAAEPSQATCVHALVTAQAARTPHAVAVVYEEERLSYAELERRANQLAHHLLARGVRPGDRVGLCVERSLELAVGVLGILKTGAAYLPLDPGDPVERLAFMLEDATVPVVVTRGSGMPVLPARVRARRVLLDVEASAIASQPSHAPLVPLSPESACYVIYTSGSTGQPKGVALPHRALCNLLAWQLRQTVKPEATTLQFAALSFDVSFQELFSTWCAGGTLVMPTASVRRDMPALLELMARTGVERMFLPFVALQALADAVAHGARPPPRLREVVTAGEQLQVTPAVVALFEKLPGCVLENQYGPSETHVVSAYRLEGAPASWPRLPPIGTPLPDTRLYVLDARGQPCALGVPGELYLGGVQVAHGYLGRPALTAERFVPDPFSREPGARLYRTGDRARWKGDGVVEYLGRLDGQVKVRGFRIELGEVEAALRDAAGVRDAAAVVREDVPGDRRLVGYVVLRPDTAWAPESLRESLRRRLPEYMVPSALVRLEALPLTPSGKLARRLLPTPDAEHLRGEAPFVAPRSKLEQSLAEVFASVLGVPRVGVTDNFFSLGGHSLLATQVVSRLRASLKREVPLRELFEAPTVEALARRLGGPAPTEARGTAAPVIGPRPVEAELSFSQQRLWFLDQLQPGTALYNMPAALRLEGVLDVMALERAFTELVHRHQALRTTFRAREGRAVQVISPAVAFAVPVEDLGHLPEPEREGEAMARAREEARRPFDLARGPLLRTRLLRLSEHQHLLLVTMHHIVSDGWSLSVLIHELAALYEAFVSCGPSPLPPLPIQYADFAAWQREWLQGEVLATQLDYWRTQLDGAPVETELPTDRPRMPGSDSPGASLASELPLALTQALTALCQREGATLFMGLLAGLQALLSRYSGQDDVCVGAPIAGRTQTETEGLIGVFVNTLVLRTRLEGTTPFRELLGRVKDVTLGAYAHQDVPFEKLVEVLQPPRRPGRTPFFQVALALLNLPPAKLELPGLKMAPLAVDIGTSRFDLSLVFEETPRGLRGTVEYRTDLYDAATVARMMEHLRVLLEDAVLHPERRLSALSLMTAAEQHRVLVEWSTPAVAPPPDASVHALFSAQAARTPEAVSVSFEGGQLTYGALEHRANQLAAYLRARGVRPGARVGVCLERSVELVVALLGILKAGAAYVPLDPSHPAERLALLLQEAGIGVIVTREALADELPASAGLLVLVDAEADGIASRPGATVSADVSGEALAYVMFTSGSTGRPKGVCIPHRAIVRLVMGTAYLDFGPGEVFLQQSTVSFDASTVELWGALLHGARLVLAPAHPLSLEALAGTLTRHSISALFLTTALFDQMVQYQPEALARVRQLMVGGEAMPVPRARQHLARMVPGTTFIHVYGPTENTTFSTALRLSPGAAVEHSLPIGRPIAHSSAYVLDAVGQPVPVGVPGELYVGGAGLAWGYLNRPELTAERFVPHPFSATPGARLYRTGDRARWRADGTLEFLGRTDFQVKVRGFRIEPGEVEAVLRQAAGVQDAMVVAREDVPGDKRLVAYVVGPAVDPRALRALLQQKLPEYMVPSAFAVLEALPLNAHGKVDRQALPAPEAPASDAERFVAPRTPVEEQLASLWRELLHVPRVGVHDDFFELGGHSLLATQLLSRLRDLFGGEPPLSMLFEAPTLAEQAARVEALAGKAAPLQAAPLKPVPRHERVPLSFAQQRLWFLDRLEPGGSVFNIPIALHIEGALDVSALERAFQDMVRRHEALRTVFLDLPEGPAQVVLSGLEPRLSVEDLRVLPAEVREAEARRLEEEEARRPFDLSTGPLLRATLLRVQEAEYVLLLTMHHIASDGWSMGVLVREVAALYAAHREGRPSPLPALPVQYADYAAWQRDWLKGDVLESQLAYWRRQLKGAPAVLELPADRPRPAARTYRGATHLSTLAPALAERLEALARREGATLFMLLMAGFQSLLHRYSGQTDLVVGTDVANRNRAETEPLIGFFINQLALRLRLEGNPGFLQVLQQARRVAMDAYAYQDLPFEEVVRALNPERSLAHAPVFQVKFVLQNMPLTAPALPGLKLRFGESHPVSSKLDLTVLVSPTPEGLVCAWMYSTDLFEAVTVARMARHFERVLEAVAAEDGRQRLSELPLMTDAERHRVLVEWNDTAAPYARRCLHELVSEQAARVPDAVAVVAGDERLTYAELERRANQLGHWLKALGVEPETRVGLFVERRAHALVGLLGILKAGGAYVPIDPAYAHMSERVRHVLRDARVQVIVTEEALANELPSQGEFLVSLDAEDGLLESQPEEPPASGVGPGNAAYIIYTSGSTGQPKGVCIEHGQLACYVAGVSRRLELPQGMSFASVSTLAADLGHTALFPTLCAGGAVHLVGRETASDAALMAAYGREHGVEGLKIVPTHLEALLTGDDARALLPRKRLVLGGDRAEWALVERVHALAPECEVFNHYGPTETTVGVLAQRVERGEHVPGAQSVPLGRPLGNVRVYVLDGYGQPVPPGVPGELYVGGQSVGRGYLGRPDGTAERFLPDGFSGEPGARLYRTGDRVRWLEDGRIEFLGRVDHQLKIRGFRVELGEVEAVLAQHPGVSECVVVAREDVPGDRHLVAYAVGRPGKTLEEASLREHLARRLPDYMVPSACVVLEALPLTENGKVDRKALPAPSRRRETQYVEPRTETEARLAALWKELLGVPRVGARDDFFDLGGHSLLATQVVARVRSLFDVQIAVIDLFEAPTLEALAARIEAGGTSDSPLVTLRKGGGARPFFCVHPVGGGVLAYLELAKRMDADQPFYGLQVPAEGSGDSVEEMAERYLEAVRAVQPEGPYLLGGWSMGGRVAYEMARQLEARGEEVGLLVVIDARGRDGEREEGDTEARGVEGNVEREAGRAQEQVLEVVLEFASHLSRLSSIHPRAAEVLEQVDAVELAAVLDGRPGEDSGLDEEACAELRALWAMFARNRRASRAYVPGPFGGSLVLLRAAEGSADVEEDLGWGGLARGGVEVREVPGDHYGLVAVPHVERLAEVVRELLARARAAESMRKVG
jgi:natural product biosynthesis luciferase-like monooxygenase protein/amino acid adenylation domain-containing protein